VRRLRTSIATGLVAALAISALAVPAAAAGNRHATVVNGIPDTRVDVCIGSTREIRSGLKYGGVFKTSLNGRKQFQFRKASPGVCKGKVLARRWVSFPIGADKTIVPTSKSPGKVSVFSNASMNGLDEGTGAFPINAALAVRHAADLRNNNVYFRWTFWNKKLGDLVDEPFRPSAEPVPFDKRDEFTSGIAVVPNHVLRVKATRVSVDNVLAMSVVELEATMRHEFILVGNKRSNAKVVRVVSVLPVLPFVHTP